MIPWYVVLPEAAGLATWAYFAGRARLFEPRRRRREAAAGVADGMEAHIAVGSLARVAPSDIRAYVLLVVTHSGNLRISGTGPASLKALIVAKASAGLAERAFAEHDAHDHEREQ